MDNDSFYKIDGKELIINNDSFYKIDEKEWIIDNDSFRKVNGFIKERLK